MPHSPMLPVALVTTSPAAITDNKPLPSVPLFPVLTDLSTTSRHHLQRIIKQSLSEDTQHVSEEARNEWTRVIEHALDELGEAVHRGAWLEGTRRKKTKRKSRVVSGGGVIVGDESKLSLTTTTTNGVDEEVQRKVSEVIASLNNPPEKKGAMHLLLCVEKQGAASTAEDHNGGSIACIFTAGSFPVSDLTNDPTLAITGLHEWTEFEQPVSIVGGTFTLKGITSPLQYNTICKTLRLAVYTRLSLILEQHFLADSNVKVSFPEPRTLSPVISHRLNPHHHHHNHNGTNNTKFGRAPSPSSKRSSFLSSGILSIFSKGRSPGASPRGGPLELPPATLFPVIPEGARTPEERSLSTNNSPRASPGGSPMGSPRSRFRRFSILGDGSRPSFLTRSPTLTPSNTLPPHLPSDALLPPFQSVLERVKNNLDLYSISPSLSLAPPPILVSLAEKEKNEPGRKLLGDEKAGLTSLNGWSSSGGSGAGGGGKDDKQLSGTYGLIRHQQLSFLFCQHITCSSSPTPSSTSTSVSVSTTSTSTSSRPRSSLDSSASTVSLSSTVSKDSSTFTSSPAPPHAPPPTPLPPPLAKPTNGGAGGISPCEKPRLLSSQFYGEHDQRWGDFIVETVERANEVCEECRFTRAEHQRRYIHGSTKITIDVPHPHYHSHSHSRSETVTTITTGNSLKDDGTILMWLSCAVCNKTTEKKRMSDGAYLFSFAKFLELLAYSPALAEISTPRLCEHTSNVVTHQPRSLVEEALTHIHPSHTHTHGTHNPHPPSTHSPSSSQPLPRSRVNILRHFAYRGVNVDVSVSIVDEAFDVRVPRLQIMKTSGSNGPDKLTRMNSGMLGSVPTTPNLGSGISGGGAVVDVKASKEEVLEEEKRVLRSEIMHWFQGVSEHIDKLEAALSVDDLNALWKTLPKLPSQDDSVFDAEHRGELSDSPPASPITPPIHRPRYFSPHPSTTSLVSSPVVSSPKPPHLQPSVLLSNLRHSFQKAEQLLYAQLAHATPFALNDVRRTFHSTARGISKRLSAWQRKHLGKSLVGDIHVLKAKEPEWWKKGHHAIPGGNVIVREDDWGSIIAFTLGSVDYQKELNNLLVPRNTPTVLPSPSSPRTSYFPNARFFSTEPDPLDPDQEGLVWHEPEPYTTVISRKDHTKDHAALNALRGVLRHKTAHDSHGSPGNGHTTAVNGKPFVLSLPPARTASLGANPMPPSAWAKPAVQINTQAVPGEVTGLPETKDVAAEKILHDLELNRPASILSTISTTPSQSETIDTHVRRTAGLGSSLTSLVDSPSIASPELPSLPPNPPPKTRSTSISHNHGHSHRSSTTTPGGTPGNQPSGQTTPTQSGFSSIAGSIVHAMRLVLHNDTSNKATSPLGRTHHGLLTMESTNNIDERPHIKYEWTIGRRLKFSCTVYYARQYDSLRKRCGIDDTLFLKSMSESRIWAADGGKSKSNFRKTMDDRFIIKTLVNGWGVADMQVLLERSPFYFRYLDSTSNRATVLAKCIGFYTIEVKNLETGATQSKVDLLVMENLFFNQKITKAFDLKGIQGRKIKTKAQSSKTLFDGEWIEGQQKTLSLLKPHSKAVLSQAIRGDADFLAKCNIMDYSLLVGVDEEHKQIICGLVDTIGSYTFGKTLEYKAKHNLQSGKGKEVTVVPPREYQERFVNSLERYFLPCPDKWCKPVDEKLIITEVEKLPGVF